MSTYGDYWTPEFQPSDPRFSPPAEAYDPDLCPNCKQDYLDDDGECDYCLGVYDDVTEPPLDFGYEHDSSMTSVGWGTDEDYGYFGGDDDGY